MKLNVYNYNYISIMIKLDRKTVDSMGAFFPIPFPYYVLLHDSGTISIKIHMSL